jgi:hypothetical protein
MFSRSPVPTPRPHEEIVIHIDTHTYPATVMETTSPTEWRIAVANAGFGVPVAATAVPGLVYWGTYEHPHHSRAVIQPQPYPHLWSVRILGESPQRGRQSPRIPLTLPIAYGADSARTVTGTTVNMSRTGCRFTGPEPLVIGRTYYVQITWGHDTFEWSGRAVRSKIKPPAQWDMAVAFLHLTRAQLTQLETRLQRAAHFHESFPTA